LLYGTLVTMANGRRVPIENLQPGDLVLSLSIPGLLTDQSYEAQYDWSSSSGLDHTVAPVPARVSQVQLGEHEGFYVINGRIKATFEHPFLRRRGSSWGFASADRLRVGDRLVTHVAGDLGEEPITSIELVEARARTVRIYVPGTNTFTADGAWTHNTSFSEKSSGAGNSPES